MKTPSPHYFQLDVLRGLAALSVFLFHWYGQCWGEQPWDGWWRIWNHAESSSFFWLYPLSFGWLGVPLFFVLSGFCIHLNWASGKKLPAGQFYWRRFWRIVPVYWCVLIFFSIRSWQDFSGDPDRNGNLISHFFFGHNFNQKWFFSICPAFWSLAVEVQFYLIYPLFLKLRNRWSLKRIMVWALVIAVVGRLIPFFNTFTDAPIYSSNTWVLWFDWLLGALLAESICNGKRLFQRPLLWLGVFITLLAMSSQFLPLSLFKFSFASVCAAVCIEQCLVKWRTPSQTTIRWITFLGVCSYSFYLWHQRFLASIIIRLPSHTVADRVLALGAAFILILAWSAVSYWLLEKSFLRLGKFWENRFFKTRDVRGKPLDQVFSGVQ